MSQDSMKKHSSRKINKKEWVVVDPQDVLRVTPDKKILLGGKEITEVDLENLQAEVKAFKHMRLFTLFDNTVRQKAIEMGFVESETWERTMSGKMMLFNLDMLKSLMASVEAVKPTPPPAPKKSTQVIPNTIASFKSGV